MSQHLEQSECAQEEPDRIRWDQIKNHSLLPHLTEDLRELFLHPDAPNSWEDPESRRRMWSFENNLNKFDSFAYMLAFGYAKDPWENREKYWDTDTYSTSEKLTSFIRHSARMRMLKKYCVSFKEAELTDDQFLSHLDIEAFYDREIDIYSHHMKIGRVLTVNDENAHGTIENELDVEQAVSEHVHRSLENIVRSILNISDIKETMTNHAFDFLKQKGVLQVLEGPENDAPSLFSATGTYKYWRGESLFSLGINTKPDLVVAYSADIKKKIKQEAESVHCRVVGVSALGEVKGPWLMLADSLKMLKKLLIIPDQQSTAQDHALHRWFVSWIAERAKPKINETDEKILDASDNDDMGVPQSVRRAAKLFEIIMKLITSALHAGVSRVMLMDLNYFLFIDINQELQISNKEYSHPDFPLLLKCKYKLMHRSHEHLRAIICAYLAPTKPMADALADYKKLVPLFLRSDLEVFRDRRTTSRPSPNPALSFQLPSKQVSTAYQEFGVFKFHENLLRKKYFVKFGEALKAYVRNEKSVNSQVLEVHSKEFLTPFFKNPTIFSNPPQNQSCILKVYDPAWINTEGRSDPEEEIDCFLPKMFRLAANELKVYEKLAPLMGSVIPTVYSYGDLIDVTILEAQAYDLFTGPYILMEMFEEKETLLKTDVNEEFVENKVIPQFQRLHQMGVVHNDIRLSNLVFTPGGDVKIIDFSHSFFSENKSDFAKETKRIYKYFKMQRKYGKTELNRKFYDPDCEYDDYWEDFEDY